MAKFDNYFLPNRVEAVTPSDVLADGFGESTLLIGVAGNVAIVTEKGDSVIVPMQAGYNPIMVTQVKATGTTATGIFRLFTSS